MSLAFVISFGRLHWGLTIPFYSFFLFFCILDVERCIETRLVSFHQLPISTLVSLLIRNCAEVVLSFQLSFPVSFG